MAGKNLVEIIIRTTKKGTGAKDAEKELSGLQGAIKTAGAALGSILTVQALKAGYELAQLGAQSIRTRNAFEAISGGADEASNRLDAMKAATRGAMSEQEMMASANRLMQMGLASNADELEEVTTMATRLGSAMGREAGPAVEEFALLLANQSIPRLDTFGISAGRVRTRMAELAAEFPNMTREARFMQATMEQGEAAMARLGDAAEDEMLAFERLEARTKDLKAAIGEQLAPVLAEALEAGMLLLEWNQRIEEATMEHASAVATEATTYQEYRDELLRAAEAAGLVVDSHGNLIERYTEIEVATGMVINSSERLIEADYLMSEAAFNAGAGMGDLTVALQATEAATATASSAMYDLNTSSSTVAKTFGELEFDDETLWNLAMASGASAEALGILAERLGIANSAQIEASLKTFELVEQFGEGAITAAELQQGYMAVGRESTATALAQEEQKASTEELYDAMSWAGIQAGDFEDAEVELEGATQAVAWAAAQAGRDATAQALAMAQASQAATDTIEPLGKAKESTDEFDASVQALEPDIRAITENLLMLKGVLDEVSGTHTVRLQYETPSSGLPTGRQAGTFFHAGGATIVGEGGAEMAFLPRGTQIAPAWHTREMMARSDNRQYTYGGDTILVQDPMAAAMIIDEKRRLQRQRLG